MLEKIRVRNYKAFEDATIPIKPITILLGANSVGKSSIIQLLLLLQQTAKEDYKSYKSALKLWGGTVNLGDSKNLFRKHDTTNPLKITFSIINDEFGRYLTSLKHTFVNSFFEATHYFPIQSLADIRLKYKKAENINDSKKFEDFINVFASSLTKEHASRYISSVNYIFSRHGLRINLDELKDVKKLCRVYNFLENISKNVLITKEFDFYFKVAYKKNKLILENFRIEHEQKSLLGNEKKVLIGFRYNKNPEENHIFSDHTKFSTSEGTEILNYFNESNTLFNCFTNNDDCKEKTSTIISYMVNVLIESLRYLKQDFSETAINYVSPLRAHPKRYYMLDKAKTNITLDTLDGDDVADVLKNNTQVTRSVNRWLEKFDLKINVKEFKEVVHHLVVKQNEVDLDITDVGFGISQVLPVIIQGFLSKNNSVTIIEQPEIHLHPKMQADLADLFVDIVKLKGKKKLIIETHSEYILKRLRKKIAKGEIKAEDVAICSFYPQSNGKGAEIKSLDIAPKGYFEYPADFYDDELFNDITEYLINQ